LSLDRHTIVLEAIAIAGQPLSASDVSDITRLPLATCYRLLRTLKEQQLIEDPELANRYVIGRRLVRIASLAKHDSNISTITAPILQSASDEFVVPVFLSRIRTRGIGIIHVETPSDPAIAHIHPGLGNRPMHACSCAKAIAAFADDGFRQLILNGPMKAYTEYTLTQRADLEKQFTQIVRQGYAECVEEIEVGVASVAAPVHAEDGGTAFSVGAIGSTRKFSQRYRKQLGGKLIPLAERIGHTIYAASAP